MTAATIMEDVFNQGWYLQACSKNIFPECPLTLIVLSCWGANQLLIRKEVIQCLGRRLIWCTVRTSELGKFLGDESSIWNYNFYVVFPSRVVLESTKNLRCGDLRSQMWCYKGTDWIGLDDWVEWGIEDLSLAILKLLINALIARITLGSW